MRVGEYLMKGDHQVVAAIVIFIVGAFIGGLTEGKLVSTAFEDYVPALATLLAAFIGASYAFKLQSDKEKRDISRANIVAGNLAVFNLIQKVNTLLDYQKQVIEPTRGKISAFIEMQPTLQLLKDDIQLDLDSLAFLLSSDDPNLLGELSVEKSRFRRAIDAINERSQLHLGQVQPILEQAGVVEGADYTTQQIEKALGTRLYVTMHQATDQVIDHVDSTIVSLQEAGAKLADMLKMLYPGEKIISLAVPENETEK